MQPWQYISLLVFVISFVILYFTIRGQYGGSNRPAAKMRYVWWVTRFSIIITIVVVLILRAASLL